MSSYTTYGACPMCNRNLGVNVGQSVPEHEWVGTKTCPGSWKSAVKRS